MREILFRGQIRRHGEKINPLTGEKLPSKWVYGGALQGTGTFSIIYGCGNPDQDGNIEKNPVYTETLGQYIGLKDKNGKQIFEGDIVRYIYEPGEGFWNANQLSVISYRKTGFHMKGIFGTNKYACMGGWLESIPFNQEAENIPEFEVIGNIHDNPELIAEVQE